MSNKKVAKECKKELGLHIKVLMAMCGFNVRTAAKYFELSEHTVRNYTYGRVYCVEFVLALREVFNRIYLGDAEDLPDDSIRVSNVMEFFDNGDPEALFGIQDLGRVVVSDESPEGDDQKDKDEFDDMLDIG